MKSIICTQPGKLVSRSADFPILRDGYSLIQIKRIGICGTDLHAFEGTQPFFNYPRILGHELGGQYITGDAEGFVDGDHLTVIPYEHCHHCFACGKGLTNCCEHLRVLGVHTDGGMVEYLSVPSSLLVHGQGLPLDSLALIEPFSIAAHGVDRAQVTPGEHVLVIGAGPIGLAAAVFARIAGATVINIDVNKERLAFSSKLGINFTLDAASAAVHKAVADITCGQMPSVVIDATGNIGAINGGFSFLSHTGRYVVIGLQKNSISVNHPEFHKREATLMSSRNATRKDFEHVVGAVKQKLIDPAAFITRRITFDSVANEFSFISSRTDAVKTIIDV